METENETQERCGSGARINVNDPCAASPKQLIQRATTFPGTRQLKGSSSNRHANFPLSRS